VKKNIVLLLFSLLLLTACAKPKGGNEDYTQKELPTPDRIQIQTGNSVVSYDTESEEYARIWDALRPNWWKTAADTPETAPDDALFLAESPALLNTTSNRTYLENGDTLVYFFYESAPLKWVEPNGKTVTDISLVTFLMPPKTESTENVRGFFMVSKGTEVGINEGLFTYYYPPEVSAGFWDWLTE